MIEDFEVHSVKQRHWNFYCMFSILAVQNVEVEMT